MISLTRTPSRRPPCHTVTVTASEPRAGPCWPRDSLRIRMPFTGETSLITGLDHAPSAPQAHGVCDSECRNTEVEDASAECPVRVQPDC
eukprot:1443889-Rhodomonas_salina.1